MHDIEPWFGWREEYRAEEDRHSPFYGQSYSEFEFTNKIYNYYIHPQWDDFGSETLYTKILYVDYAQQFALIELIGEWNDAIENDIMYFKRDLIDLLIKKDISRFVIFCDNVLNFHGDDDDYYGEWYDDVRDEDGWICFVNVMDHVLSEMKKYRLHHYVNYGEAFNDIDWRRQKPSFIIDLIDDKINNTNKRIS